MTTKTTPTRADVERLKSNWLEDPCFDIEEADGYEAFREELRAFRQRKEENCRIAWTAKLEDKAEAIGCPLNTQLAEYVLGLERRLELLESDEENRRFK